MRNRIVVFLTFFIVLLWLFAHHNKPKAIRSIRSIRPPPIQSEKPKVLAGDNVQWSIYAPISTSNNKIPFLADIESHLLPSERFHHSDPATCAHESTHGIHSALRRIFGSDALYVGNNQVAVMDKLSVKVRMQDIAPKIPADLRGSRYRLYLILQQKDWDNQVLYLFDEWICYINGAIVAIEGSRSTGKSDLLLGIMEFNVYCCYTVKLLDDAGHKSKQLDEFLAWSLRHGLEVYQRGMKLNDLNWDNGAYWEKTKANQELTAYLTNKYGQEWVNKFWK